MVILKKSIPRRTFLRGAGATLALPMLDAMTPAFAVEAAKPIRMAFFEVPNGIFNLNHEWTPKTEGTDWEMTPTLKPLEAFRDRMLVVQGLDHQQAAGRDGEVGGDHPRACTAFLTGTHAKMTSGADIRGGISVDQIAAKEFGKHTQLASLEIGLESSEIVGACESAYGCAYYDTISWRNETTPLPMENRPRAGSRQGRQVSGRHPRRRTAHAAGRETRHPRSADRNPRRRSGSLLGLFPVDGRSDGSLLADRHDARHDLPDGP